MKGLWRLNIKTIYFNFKYLPYYQAILFPVRISNRVSLLKTEGKIKFECPVVPGMIKIGYGEVGIFDKRYSRTVWQVSGEVIFRGAANIGHGSKLSVSGKLILGNEFSISAESAIIASNHVEFGDNCLLSWDILIMDTDFHDIKDKTGCIINPASPIKIGNKVWIGCRSLVLKGVTIADNSVVAANSTVTKSITQANAVHGGEPLRVLKEDISWEFLFR